MLRHMKETVRIHTGECLKTLKTMSRYIEENIRMETKECKDLYVMHMKTFMKISGQHACTLAQVKPLLSAKCKGNHSLDWSISWISEGEGNLVIDKKSM